MKMHKIIREIADDDRAYDPYGAGNTALFAVCEALTIEGEGVPPEVGYRPGVFGAFADPQDSAQSTILAGLDPDRFPGYWVEGYTPNLTVEDLQYAARILSRYIAWVTLAGRSY